MTSTPNETDPGQEAEAKYEQQVRKHLVRNFLAHMFDQGLYLGGRSFLAPVLVMPQLIKSLGGPGWLMAAMPMVGMIGFFLPPLLTAHWIERMYRFRPLILIVGAFQRLCFVPGALALWFLADDYPLLTLALVALAPAVAGLIAGIGSTAWQELVACTIPPNRRASLVAFRNILSGVIGMAAGVGVYAVLERYGGTRGYSLLHWITFGFLVLSYFSFCFTREVSPPRRRPTGRIGLGESIKLMPGIVRADQRLRRYILAIMGVNGLRIMLPFLSPHILDVLGESPSYLGVLVLVSMVGTVVANAFAGIIGDRCGGKVVMVGSWVGLLTLCVWAPLATTVWEFWIVIFLNGAGTQCYMIGKSTLSMELCPRDTRVRYLAVMAACEMVSLVAVWAIASVAWHLSGGSFGCVAALAAGTLILAGYSLLRIEEPRGRQ